MTPLEKCATIRRQTLELKTTFKDCWAALVRCNMIVELTVLYLKACYDWDNSVRVFEKDVVKRDKWAYDTAKETYLKRVEARKVRYES